MIFERIPSECNICQLTYRNWQEMSVWCPFWKLLNRTQEKIFGCVTRNLLRKHKLHNPISGLLIALVSSTVIHNKSEICGFGNFTMIFLRQKITQCCFSFFHIAMVCAFWYRHTLPLLWPLYLTTIVCRIFLWKGKSFLLPIMTQPNYEKQSQHYLFNISY